MMENPKIQCPDAVSESFLEMKVSPDASPKVESTCPKCKKTWFVNEHGTLLPKLPSIFYIGDTSEKRND